MPALQEAAQRLEAQGRTVMFVATLEPASVLLGLIAVMDTVEPTVAAGCLRPPRGDARNPGSSRALAVIRPWP